ncbi:MAG: enoyl-CoA hydratase-related protein [Chloroflexota bacterium]|nr:enoyl-CoA hydratase-related protein [Chloroflexota bacterium]
MIPLDSSRFEHLLIERPTPHVVLVTLNRPDVLNAINTRMGEEIAALFQALSDDGEVRAIVLSGAGERAFCTGADLKERQGMSDTQWHAQHRIFEAAFRAVLECRHPVIAAVDGYALAGGLELALNCDLIIAGRGASFAQPEVMRGIMPGGGGTQLLPRLIGPGRAKELIFSGRRIDAETAECWGLVARVVDPGRAQAEAVALATQIAANGPIAVRQAKLSINRGLDTPLHHALAVELDAYAACIPTEDRHEGIRAFNERRPPEFKGR